MNSGQTGWILLFLMSLFLIVIGIQGNLGVTVAILFSPAHVTLDEGGTATPATIAKK